MVRRGVGKIDIGIRIKRYGRGHGIIVSKREVVNGAGSNRGGRGRGHRVGGGGGRGRGAWAR